MSDDPSIAKNAFDPGALPELERMVGGDVVDEVLGLYLANSPKRLAAVRAGLRSDDPDAVARALHDLKSSAGMVGANEVMRLAEELERLARARDLKPLAERLERLESAATRVDDYLRKLLEERAG